MSIVRILDWMGERRTKTRVCHDQSPVSIPMDGNATAEDSFTPQSLPDSPKTRVPLTDLTVSPPPGAFRYCDHLTWRARSPAESAKISIRHKQGKLYEWENCHTSSKSMIDSEEINYSCSRKRRSGLRL